MATSQSALKAVAAAALAEVRERPDLYVERVAGDTPDGGGRTHAFILLVRHQDQLLCLAWIYLPTGGGWRDAKYRHRCSAGRDY